MTTSQRSNPNALAAASDFSNPSIGTTIAPDTHSAPWAQPVPVWIGLFALLVVAKYAAERGGEGGEFSSIRLGFWNIAVITAVAILGINAAKWIFGYWRVPGISALVLAS